MDNGASRTRGSESEMNQNTSTPKIGAALVVGGGIGGMQAALDLAASGIKVYLADRKPAIGGVMSQLDKTFPTNDCAMCTMAPRLVEIGRHKDIEIIANAEVDRISGEAGNFKVVLTKKARYVDEGKCTGCGTCVSRCPVSLKVQPLERQGVELEAQFAGVKDIIEKHRNREGPLMPILQEINASFHYLPENALRYVSQETGVPLSQIMKIATFYNAFSVTPRGRHTVNVCLGTTCYIKGAGRLMEKFSENLGIQENETTADMKFTLKSVRCIGCCGLAPAVMVGEAVFGKLAVSQIPDIVQRYREVA
jgi:NADH:ubiquinone oxidoreductase subunit E/NAD-dependent dihydropyrimidine dehydrogenase PreA subunit